MNHLQTPYIALKTDIIHSRRITERRRVQDHFLNVAQQVNTQFAADFESGFIVTHGDEAQCLIKSEHAASTIKMIEFLVEVMAPVELRFGLGYGTLNTKVQKMAIGMDGEVWQNAKDAIEAARKSHQVVCFRGFDPKVQFQVEPLTNLVLFLHARWTEEQLQVIKLIRAGQTQSLIAKYLGVSEAAISKRLRAAGWHEYCNSIEALERLLSQTVVNS